MQTKIPNTTYKFFPVVKQNRLVERKRTIIHSIATLFLLCEFFLITVLFFWLYSYRTSIEFDNAFTFFSIEAPRFKEYMVFYIVSILLLFIWIYKYKIYSLSSIRSYLDEIYKIVLAYSFSILITIGFAFIFKINEYSRLVILSYWIFGIVLSGIIRFAKALTHMYLARNDYITKNVLIIGAGNIGQTLAKELIFDKKLGYRVVGFLDDFKTSKEINPELSLGVVGEIKDIRKIISANAIDEIIITIPSQRQIVDEIIQKLRKLSVTIKVIPEMFNLVTTSVEFGSINALPYVTLVKTPMRGIGYFIKRSFDIIATSLLILVLVPLFIGVGIVIKLDTKGAIIYKQPRVGKNGKLFYMYKFRSMVQNAEMLQRKYSRKNEVDGPAFKLKNDPRVTRVGRFIRKYSIDELPQLFNVLKGEMSLVGPRPPLPIEVDKYSDWEWRRLEVVPGITGLWQVSGRSDLSFQQWMNLDIYYIENWSLLLDLKILLKTIPVVIKGEGAY